MKNKKKASYIITLSALVSLGFCLYNKLSFVLNTSRELLFSNNGNYYTWRFGKVFYNVKGSGSPILLIHDLTACSSGYEWKKISDEFAKQHTVYTIDLLGCGRSDKPKMTYTSYLYVQLLSDFIKNIIKKKTCIISTGNSCSFALMTCYIEPHLIDNMILVNPNSLTHNNKYPAGKDKLLKWIIDTPVLGTFLYNTSFSKRMIRKKFRERFMYNSQFISRKVIHAYCESAHLGGSSARYIYSSTRCNYTTSNIYNALKNINNNVQLILGEFEPDKDEIIKSYTEINPSIEYDTISTTKHLPQIESPERFIACCEIYIP